MMNVLSALFLLLAVLSHSPASAGAPNERIALMLTGSSCREAHQTIDTVLRRTGGVFAVDGVGVPEHLLIDVEEGKTSAQDLLTIVRTAIGTDLSCQVEIMRSCITAPGHNRTDAPAK